MIFQWPLDIQQYINVEIKLLVCEVNVLHCTYRYEDIVGYGNPKKK